MDKTQKKIAWEEINPNLNTWSRGEYLFFFVLIPFILVAIYFVPAGIKEQLFLFYPKNPTILSAFLSHYTHSTLDHISANLFSYLIVMGLLFWIESDKKIFYVVMAFSFILVPFLLSWITTQFLNFQGNSQGFSGIVAALIGYCAYASYNFLKKRHAIQADANLVLMVFMVNAIVAVSSYWLGISSSFAVVIGLLLICYTYWNRKPLLQIVALLRTKIKEARTLPRNVRGPWLAFFIFDFVMLFLALPQLISLAGYVPGQPFPNIAAHYFGYVFGLFLPVFIEAGEEVSLWIKKHRHP